MSEKKAILVTGGAGFIGFSTAKKLLEFRKKIIILDNFNDYYDPRLKKDRISVLKDIDPDLKVFEQDLAGYNALEKVFKENKIGKV